MREISFREIGVEIMQTPHPQRRRFLPRPPLNTSRSHTLAQCLDWFFASYDGVPAQRPPDSTPTLTISVAVDLAQAWGSWAVSHLVLTEHLATLLSRGQPLLARWHSTEGELHWVLIWSRLGDRYQVADPVEGLRWLRLDTLTQRLHRPVQELSTEAWQDLRIRWRVEVVRRLEVLQFSDDAIRKLLAEADRDAEHLATFDAATRMVTQMVARRGIRKGDEALSLLRHLTRQALVEPQACFEVIPQRYWQILPPNTPDADAQVRFAGCEVIALAPPEASPDLAANRRLMDLMIGWTPPSLRSYIMREPTAVYLLLFVTAILAAAGVFAQAVLLRALLGLWTVLDASAQRLTVIGLLVGFGVLLLLLKWAAQRLTLHLGHRLESRLRLGFVERIPTLGTQGLNAFSLGDLYERIHSLRAIRQLPNHLLEFVQLFWLLVFTALALFWLNPFVGLLASINLLLTGAMVVFNHLINSEGWRTRHLLGKLSHFYLDVLHGMVPIRAHTAEATMQREYEKRAAEWASSRWSDMEVEVVLLSLAALVSHVLVALLIVVYALRDATPENWLLLIFWGINLNIIGKQLLDTLFYFRRDQHKVNRYMQLVHLPAAYPAETVASQGSEAEGQVQGVQVELENVTVRLQGQTLLRDINLNLAPGAHIAVLGASGAGKSSLAALLLGLIQVRDGGITIDGQPATVGAMQALRRQTVWVGPDVKLWNAPFLDNLRYAGRNLPIQTVLQDAELGQLLDQLTDGLQTHLGEDGRRISGGEGQRVRFGRALQQANPRLAVLDEAFREMEPMRKERLLRHARQVWAQATLVFITHDPLLTADFDQVLIMDQGTIVEMGAPGELATRSDSLYRAALDAAVAASREVWQSADWQRWHLADGQVQTH